MTDISVDYRISPKESQIIKGFAICAMLVHHLFWEHPEYGVAPYQIALAGKVCVALFVFLSGYGMAIQFVQIHSVTNFEKNQNTLRFICKRLVKFYMNYWVVFLISVPLGVLVFGRPLEAAYGNQNDLFFCLMKDFLGFQSFGSYNITWWFNAIILSLWILFPFIYWSMRSRLVALPMMLLLFFNPGDILFPLHRVAPGLPFYLIIFAEGVFIAINADLINKFLNKIKKKIVLVSSIVLTLFLLLARNLPIVPNFNNYTVDSFVVVSLALAVVSLSRTTNASLAFGAFLGRHSMNIYLLHTFVFSYFFSDFIYGFKNPVVIFLALLGVSLALSIIVEFLKKQCRFYVLLKKISGYTAPPTQERC